jgi:hypothetical protein
MNNLQDFYNWVVRNYDAIVTGIVSSFIVIALQVSVATLSNTISYFLTFRLRLIRLISFKNKENIYVVSGNKSEQYGSNSAALLMGPDASAANLVYRTLEQLYADSEIKHLYSSTGDHSVYNDENVVSVGGPVFNTFTKAVIDHLGSDIYFDASDKLHVYENEYEKNETTLKDYGLIIKLNNPYRPSRKVIIVAGCGSNGCLAASFILTKNRKFPNLRKTLMSELGLRLLFSKTQFVAVVSCRIAGNDVSNVKLETAKIIKPLN